MLCRVVIVADILRSKLLERLDVILIVNYGLVGAAYLTPLSPFVI
jgi:hypothetical protein